MIPSATDLNYFLEVSETGNISRAAERLGLSQPSLTLAIRRLERDVGAPLLTRSRKGVSLTPAGRQVQAKAKLLAHEWENVRRSARRSHDEVRGRFKLGCHVSVGLYSLSRFLPQLLRRWPELEIHLVHDLSRKITEQVISGNVDVGIAVNPVRHPDLVIQELCKDEVTFWRGTGASGKITSGAESATLICDPELIQTQDLMAKAQKHAFQFTRFLTTSSLEIIANLTAGGAGIGILPGRVAAGVRPRLRRVPAAPVYGDRICIVYRSELRRIRAVQEIVARVGEAF